MAYRYKTRICELEFAPANPLLAGGQSYILPKGKVGERDPKKKLYLCWQEDEGKLYYVCPSCSRISRMTANTTKVSAGRRSGLFLDGDKIGTYGCEYCPDCGSHLWFILKDFPVKSLRKKINDAPNQCPICDGGHLVESSGFTACNVCTFHWRPMANRSGQEETVEDQETRAERYDSRRV